MNAAQNKHVLEQAFAELALGNGKPFVDLMADDFCWTVPGSNRWSGTYRGKRAVQNELLAPLFARFAGRYTNRASRLIAEDDFVVVECRGQVTTKSGIPYNNTYCYVCRLADGRLKELTEYMDTELVTAALGD
jgi:uncharacterized protein